MLIVGAGGALTAIAAFYAWLFIHKLRVSGRERKAKERLARRRAIEEHEHEHAHQRMTEGQRIAQHEETLSSKLKRERRAACN